MSRLNTRDYAVSAVFVVGAFSVVVLALAGRLDWAVAILGALAGLIGVATGIAPIQLFNRQDDLQRKAKTARATRRAAEHSASATRALAADLAGVREDVSELRDAISAVRGDTSHLRSEVAPVRAVSPGQLAEGGRLNELHRFRVGETKRPIGIVGFFGHGNYGDELFLDVFRQFLGSKFDLKVIPDLERAPYFSRPVEEKVAEVDAIVMGGGDLIQRWNTDPRYFDPAYLRKPFYLAGVGVPIYQNSAKHEEKPHIINRLRRFLGDPNVRMIGMRDDFGADWIRKKLEPTAPISSEPDIVCSLDLPPATKPAGLPILGIVTRQRRVSTPDDYTRLEELAAHATRRGFRIRQIILGIGSVGERDLANAPALNVPDKEVIYSENLDELSRAIGECTVLASMKFHGTVVATMYGVPSIVLVPTNKNRQFMARIGRSELVASHDSDRLIEIFGENGPDPIDREQVMILRARSTAFMGKLRDHLINEVESQLSVEMVAGA